MKRWNKKAVKNLEPVARPYVSHSCQNPDDPERRMPQNSSEIKVSTEDTYFLPTMLDLT